MPGQLRLRLTIKALPCFALAISYPPFVVPCFGYGVPEFTAPAVDSAFWRILPDFAGAPRARRFFPLLRSTAIRSPKCLRSSRAWSKGPTAFRSHPPSA